MIFVSDPEYGVVEHVVYEVLTVYNTDARADDGTSWADQFTEQEIRFSGIYETREDAEHALEILRRELPDQSRA